MHPTQAARVILRHCDAYDAERIRVIVREALETFDLRPHGRTLVKPNLVAAGELFRHAHTRPEFAEGVLRALQDRDEGLMTELAVGERCAITIPTRMVFAESGFDAVIKRVGAKRYCFEESVQVEIPMTHEGRLRDSLYTPEPVAKADFFVNLPKLKAHPWTTVTFSMKNYIGIQDDRHRLIDHDHALNRKVADLQYIIQPQFIAIDGIIAGEGRMLTPKPRTLNLVVMGNNQVAIDAVCCHIIGVDPMTVEHIRLAYERGFGPIELPGIELLGDVTLEEAKGRAVGFDVGLIRIEKFFEGTNIFAYSGAPPDHPDTGYCWGGCPGVMQEVIEILRLYDDKCDQKLPRVHLVFGRYKGQLDIKYGEKVIFIGDCCEWEGNLHGQRVRIENLYKDRSTLDPKKAKHSDIYARMFRMWRTLRRAKKAQWIRLEGCPVSIGELILMLAQLGGIKNPYFDPKQALSFNRAYISWRSRMAGKYLIGKPYQVHGPTDRGSARPLLPAPRG